MKKKIVYIVLTLTIIAIAAVRLESNKEATAERVYHFDKDQAINVQAIPLKLETADNDISYTGTFEPNRETRLSADIQGKVNSMLVDVGNYVRKGQALIQLDNSLLKLQLQAVEIQIEALEADVKRYTVLTNADAIQGVQLEKAVSGLKSTRVQQASLTEQINKTTIAAPFSGIVTAKFTEAGAFAAPGMPLLQITDISLLKFTVNVPEHELSRFEINEVYPVNSDVWPETSLQGRVIMTGSKANMGNSFPIQFSVNNTPDLKIKSGMFGKVHMKSAVEEQHIIIPASAIIGTNIRPQVYTVKNGKASLRDITISTRYQNKVLVSDGLAQGEMIITNGFINLSDGANVTISN